MSRPASDVLQPWIYSRESEYTRAVDEVGGLWWTPGHPPSHVTRLDADDPRATGRSAWRNA